MNVQHVRAVRPSAAKGFFSVFYDWTVTCVAANRSLHSHCARSRSSYTSRISHNYVRTFTSTLPIRKNPASPPSPPSIPEEPVLSTHLRQLMRHMPHAVVVATSTLPSSDRGSLPQYKGMTVSSFTTLTLTPVPIVTFNIRRPSQTLDAIRVSSKFCVHILSATREGARVADVFTKGNGTKEAGDIWRNNDFAVLKGRGRDDPPLLRAKGITKVLRCEILEDKGLMEVGDHVLVLAKVVGVLQPDVIEGETIEERGLGYLDREYRTAGEVIKLHANEEKSIS